MVAELDATARIAVGELLGLEEQMDEEPEADGFLGGRDRPGVAGVVEEAEPGAGDRVPDEAVALVAEAREGVELGRDEAEGLTQVTPQLRSETAEKHRPAVVAEGRGEELDASLVSSHDATWVRSDSGSRPWAWAAKTRVLIPGLGPLDGIGTPLTAKTRVLIPGLGWERAIVKRRAGTGE